MNGLWQKAADRLRDELGQVGFETWIGPLNFVAQQGSTVTIEAPNRFFRDWITERYLPMMRTARHVSSERTFRCSNRRDSSESEPGLDRSIDVGKRHPIDKCHLFQTG